MRSAMVRLPRSRILLVSWVTRTTCRSGRRVLHDEGRGLYEALFTSPFGAVATTGLLAVTHTRGVERAADDLVANARQVLHTAASHEDDRVLLEVVANAGDVGRDLDARGQTHTRHLAKGRVRLLRGYRVDAVHTPRRCGAPSGAGVLVLDTLSCRPFRTNCAIVGTRNLF